MVRERKVLIQSSLTLLPYTVPMSVRHSTEQCSRHSLRITS